MNTGYDGIADWYEREFLASQRPGDPLEIDRILGELLGSREEADTCLDIGCGTGIYAARMHELGWRPLGVDLSARMLAYAAPRLPVVCGDAKRLPFRDNSIPAAVAIMTHTDMPDYPAVLGEVRRILRPGGIFVHIGVHPCFCGSFADRADAAAIVIRPGYREPHWTTRSWTDRGLRDKVGAAHLPLAGLLSEFVSAGMELVGFAEGGGPTPTVLAVKAVSAGPGRGRSRPGLPGGTGRGR
ncbi:MULTISPECIES: class I SAM-dependent methyltransferase [unclassified Nocardia]|uniref:class I SAM-dependent methyltransferase n=1 Tax=unclassified Nocardia TaxID=2637762 RepID=UPI001CE42097|nr:MULTISPECIES: class I SAM-dependent methyltransferase [unclassified Nocardia]